MTAWQILGALALGYLMGWGSSALAFRRAMQLVIKMQAASNQLLAEAIKERDRKAGKL